MPKPYLRGFGFFIRKGGISMCKTLLRKKMIAQLKTITQEEHHERSNEIKERLMNIDEFKKASVIGITISRNPEVNTWPIIEAAWTLGKRVAVPKCDSKNRSMDFRLITSFEQLETVYMNLLEPIITETESVLKEHVDLQIVPGVVFSIAGYRIGFGGGFYDRYLESYEGRKISLAFGIQTAQNIPIGKYDLPVDKILTEKETINCKEIRVSK